MIDLGKYRTFLAFLSVAVFFTNFSDFSQRMGIIPLYWIVLFAGLIAPLALPALASGRLEIRPVIWWCAAFLLITIVWYYLSAQTDRSFQEVQTRILSAIFIVMMLFLFARPEDQRSARIGVAFAVLLSVALNVYELFNPMTFSSIPGRSSGLYTNVNQSGAALVLGLIIAYSVVPPRLRMLFVLAVAIGVVTTFSRAAMLGWMMVVVYFMARGGFGVAHLRRALVFGVVVVAFLVSPFWSNLEASLQERGTLTMDVVQRLSFFGGNAEDDSTTERTGVAKYAWSLFGERPLTGHGTGASRQFEQYEVGTHNIYLSMMVDHGIIGLFIAPAMVLLAIWGARRESIDVVLPFAAFLALWGLFSHNVLEERYILLSVALVASLVASERPVPVRQTRPVAMPMPSGSPA